MILLTFLTSVYTTDFASMNIFILKFYISYTILTQRNKKKLNKI